MKEQNIPIDNLLRDLKERAKELNCLYAVIEITNQTNLKQDEVMRKIIEVIPRGWQYPEICMARIEIGDEVHEPQGFQKTAWEQSADIVVQEEVVGKISVFYTQEVPASPEGPFLKEERKLLGSIAEWLSHYLLHRQLGEVFEQHREIDRGGGWAAILELLRRTNPQLLLRIARKMTNYLCWSGSKDAEKLLASFSPASGSLEAGVVEDVNRPRPKETVQLFLQKVDEVFRIALDFLGEKETLALVQRWIREDRSSFLVSVIENPASSHTEVGDALDRYYHLDPEGAELSPARDSTFRVSMIRRFLTDQPQAITVAKHFFALKDFQNLLHRVVFPAGSHGKLGGKSSGLLLASAILQKSTEEKELLQNVRIPKTWYLASDGILNFMYHNNLEDVIDQKYKDLGQVRQEYPYVVQVFKNSQFPPEIVKGLSLALDDFGDCPLIVRSSSLLEDRMGTSFAGKYKSLFIANQGTREERLLALTDAVAEVYASVFSPDPIQYRAEHGLMDFHEEMGIMIQEVVGKRIGDYFLPSYAGVAFSNNEFRWSSRIKREDGLVRLVAGLGTRAVDRLSDDYPILFAPGQPDLHVNVTLDESIRYSPKKMDVISLKTNTFESIDIRDFIGKYGDVFPGTPQIVSILDQERLRQPMGMQVDYSKEHFVVTFEGLKARTNFVKQIRMIMRILQEKLGMPVDIEFASDGENFYLLQCRPQSYRPESAPALIPPDVPKEKIVFSANKYISNGVLGGITHIVYVDPEAYSNLGERSELLAVGRAVSMLNKVLPKRRFILMGPGRWGSRGDIRLGVSVTYSDINNTAMLIEIARKKGEYVPEVSFGTHFFQDLVEESIRYLPLFPDDPDVDFNESFLHRSENMLADLLPQYASLQEVLKVIDVSRVSGGLVMDVLMNDEVNRAVGILAVPGISVEPAPKKRGVVAERRETDDHWRWRQHMAEEIASAMDAERFGVKGVYLTGSTKNVNAGPQSDIDLIIHFTGTKKQQEALMTWLDGWSFALSEMNYLRTGVKTSGLLDIHMVTDEDIRKRTSFAVKIGAVTDQARKLPLGPTKAPS
ncbi:MAG TPA: PEP/pyruvate-binding domain-containing protein [Bacteroidota bacterium]|nr:PEP/pyruvate-binding domain-containing protein [Bacteroidota bacterium]